MLNWLMESFKKGFAVPLAKDSTGKPSATLWFAYVSFLIASGSVIHFIFQGDPLAASCTAIGFWTIAMVFYRIGKLDKFKIDLDDREIELEADDESKE